MCLFFSNLLYGTVLFVAIIRGLEQATYFDVAFRVLTCNQAFALERHP